MRPSSLIAAAVALSVLASGCAEETPAAPTSPTATALSPSITSTPGTSVASTTTASIPPTSTLPPIPLTPTTIPEPVWETIGTSVMGRTITAALLGEGPVRFYILGGIHGDERGGADTAPLLFEHLLEGIPSVFTVRFVLDANPDGSIAATRENHNGIDLNRNFPTEDFIAGPVHSAEPLSEPESIALAADIEAFEPTVILALHSAWTGPFINYDGPGRELAEAFHAAAVEVDDRWTVVAELDWGTPGSLGTYWGKERGIPVLTTEPSRYDSADETWPVIRAGVDAMISMLVWQNSVLGGVR